jgi:protoporphyrinogen oxidase
VDDAPAPIRAAAEALRVNPLYYLDVALGTPARVDWHWTYVPDPALPFYRVGCYSNFSPELAPRGGSSLYVELASRTEPDLATLLPAVTEGLLAMGVVGSASDVRFARLRHVEFAYVVFDHRYYESLETLRPWLAKSRILSVGRYGGWNYSAMGDALAFGRAAAREADTLVEGWQE